MHCVKLDMKTKKIQISVILFHSTEAQLLRLAGNLSPAYTYSTLHFFLTEIIYKLTGTTSPMFFFTTQNYTDDPIYFFSSEMS